MLGHKVLAFNTAHTGDADVADVGSASVLGVLTFAGIVVAILTQPFAGWLSDRWRGQAHRRLMFMVAGSIVAVLGLVLIAQAFTFLSLLLGLIVLQFGLNTAQAPWQALIPDHVPVSQRGMASGLKALFDLIAAIVGRLVAGSLIAGTEHWGQAAVLATIALPIFALMLTLLISAGVVMRLPTLAPFQNQQPLSTAQTTPDQSTFHPLHPFDPSPSFLRWCLNRLFFWSAFIASTTFLLFIAIAVLGMREAEAQRYIGRLTVIIGLALFAVFLPAGWLADHVGRVPLIIAGGILAGVGVGAISFTRDLTVITGLGVLIGLGVGLYLSGSLALLTDIVPAQGTAHMLGLANIATASGSGLARLCGGFLVDGINTLTMSTSNGYVLLLRIAAGLFLLSAVVMLRGRRRPVSPVQSSPPRRHPV